MHKGNNFVFFPPCNKKITSIIHGTKDYAMSLMRLVVPHFIIPRAPNTPKHQGKLPHIREPWKNIQQNHQLDWQKNQSKIKVQVSFNICTSIWIHNEKVPCILQGILTPKTSRKVNDTSTLNINPSRQTLSSISPSHIILSSWPAKLIKITIYINLV